MCCAHSCGCARVCGVCVDSPQLKSAAAAWNAKTNDAACASNSIKGSFLPALPLPPARAMGAGASTIPTETNAQLAAELAANASLPASKITPAVKEFAVRLKMALSTEDGWKELQELFKSLRASLDDAVSSEEWGSMMYQYDDLRYKYFGDVTPEEIIEQFNRLDDEYVHASPSPVASARARHTRRHLLRTASLARTL